MPTVTEPAVLALTFTAIGLTADAHCRLPVTFSATSLGATFTEAVSDAEPRAIVARAFTQG